MNTDNMESALKTLSESQLRSFACDCCEPLLEMFPEPLIRESLEAGRRRSRAAISDAEIDALRTRGDRLYNSLYAAGGDPSPEVLALAAAGEPVFTLNPLTAALHASDLAAQAIAKQIAESNPDDESYDRLFDEEYDRVRASHMHLLRSFTDT